MTRLVLTLLGVGWFALAGAAAADLWRRRSRLQQLEDDLLRRWYGPPRAEEELEHLEPWAREALRKAELGGAKLAEELLGTAREKGRSR